MFHIDVLCFLVAWQTHWGGLPKDENDVWIWVHWLYTSSKTTYGSVMFNDVLTYPLSWASLTAEDILRRILDKLRFLLTDLSPLCVCVCVLPSGRSFLLAADLRRASWPPGKGRHPSLYLAFPCLPGGLLPIILLGQDQHVVGCDQTRLSVFCG